MKLIHFFEKIDDMDMGDVIKDFYKSDAKQFKGKSKKKRRQMAIAAKLSADEGVEESGCLGKQIKKGKSKKSESVEESFKHYKVKHKKSGKEYKVTAMHDKSAKEKARAKDVESTISQKNLEVKLNLLKYGAEFFICGAMKSAPK